MGNEGEDTGGNSLAHLAGTSWRRPLHEPWRPLVGEALHPLTQRRIGKRKGGGHGFKALTCDDFTDGLGTAKDAPILGLLESRGQGCQRIGRKVGWQCPHDLAPWQGKQG